MKGLSSKEMEVVANLEFDQKQFFRAKDIAKHFDSESKMRFTIHKLKKKERIIKINRGKYYLVPIRAPEGKWSEHPFIVADEMMDGEDYFIGGWSAAHYWRHTDQVPMQVDVWTTKRQGKVNLLSCRVVFHRTTKNRIKKLAVDKKIGDHPFKIMNSEAAKKWVKGRD